MELDTDILRSTYFDSVHPATIANPVPTILGKEDQVQGLNWDRTSSFTPSYGPSLTPTYKDIPTQFGACIPVNCSNPRLQTCPNPTYIEYTESEFSVPISRMKNPSYESNDYQITYNVYEDPDSPEELIIDLDHDNDYHDNYHDDADNSDFEIEPEESSTDEHRTHRHVGEIAMGDCKMISQSMVTNRETEAVSDDNPRDPTMTNATMKLRLILSPNQENVLNCQSKSNSGVPLSNECEHCTTDDSGSNTSVTFDTSVQHTYGQHNQKDASAIPSDLSQMLAVGSNAIHMNNLKPTNANPHVYPYISPVTDKACPVTRLRFGNDKPNGTENSPDEECYSHLFAHCQPSAEEMTCHDDIKENNRMILWHIPENEIRPKPDPLKKTVSLASLYNFCESATSSNQRHLMQTLRNQFAKEPISNQYSKFLNNSPVSKSFPKTRLQEPKVRAVKPSKSCTQVHSNDCLQSESYLTSSYYHRMRQQQMVINKMPMPFPWQNVPIVDDDSCEYNRSRLFDMDISNKACSSSIDSSHNTVSNKENLPTSSVTFSSKTQGSEDSGIGFHSTERVTDQRSSEDVKHDLDAELELCSELINESDSQADPSPSPLCISGSKRHSAYQLNSSAFERDVVSYDAASFFPTDASRKRRKYILDAVCPTQQFNLSEPVEQTAKDVDVLLQSQLRCSQPCTDYSQGTEGHVELQQGKVDASLTKDWTDLSSDSLSDFRALIDAFDKSPVKPAAAASCGSKAAADFPALGSLLATNVKLSKLQTPIPHRPAHNKRYTCNCCERTHFTLRTIRWHNAKKYRCCQCEKRFCLREILYKHRKKCQFSTVY